MSSMVEWQSWPLGRPRPESSAKGTIPFDDFHNPETKHLKSTILTYYGGFYIKPIK